LVNMRRFASRGFDSAQPTDDTRKVTERSRSDLTPEEALFFILPKKNAAGLMESFPACGIIVSKTDYYLTNCTSSCNIWSLVVITLAQAW